MKTVFLFRSLFNQSLEYSISGDMALCCCQGSSSTFLFSKAQWFVTLSALTAILPPFVFISLMGCICFEGKDVQILQNEGDVHRSHL